MTCIEKGYLKANQSQFAKKSLKNQSQKPFQTKTLRNHNNKYNFKR